MSDQTGVLREGFRRVWHYQRVLWFIFFISLFLGHFGASPAIHKIDRLDNSLQAKRLSDVFDVGAFSALQSNPEVKLFEVMGTSGSFSLVFLVGMLFLTGGILEAYRSGRKLTAREFFEACGAYFWRWVRLLVLMLIALIPVMILLRVVWRESTSLMGSAALEKSGFWLLLGGLLLVGFLLMSIRLWFDMAQVRAVVEEESGMIRNAGRAFRETLDNFGSLFWMYLRISLVGWLVFGGAVYVWSKMPPARFGWTLLILEMAILTGFGVRLWQRAAEMAWYQRRFLTQFAAPAPVPVAPAPSPLVTIAPPPDVPTTS